MEGTARVVDPAEVARLESEALEWAAQVHAAHHTLAELLARVDASGAWEGAGIRSIGHWADINLGIPSAQAKQLAEAGRRLPELPAVAAAFESGALSWEKVRTLLPVITPAAEAELLDVALLASAAQLRRICAAYRAVAEDESPEALEERHRRRGLWWHRDDSGLVRVMALLDPEDAAVLIEAVNAHVEAAWREERGEEPDGEPGDDGGEGETPVPVRELSTRRADALVEVAATSLQAGPQPVVRGERTEVVVHIDLELLAGIRDDGEATIDGVGRLPLSTIERLACDCAVTPLLSQLDGTPLDVGRRRRLVNRRQRRALRRRDRGCRFLGCGATRFVDAHHVLHWTKGGRTDLDNLLLLCPAHHRLFHEGGYGIERLGGGSFRFLRADGRPIEVPRLDVRRSAADPPPAPGCPRAGGGGGRFDLADTVDLLGRAASRGVTAA